MTLGQISHDITKKQFNRTVGIVSNINIPNKMLVMIHPDLNIKKNFDEVIVVIQIMMNAKEEID